jgi:membrane-associated phospholipid phosphatase
MNWWYHISALGGLEVTAPVAVAVAAWLACIRGWRLALAWCLLFGAALALAAVSQMAFLGWGVGIESLAFTGFSGHAIRAAAVFPVVLFVLTDKTRGGWQRGVVGAGVLLAVAVAVARVKIGAHSPSEASAGCLLGLVTAALFIARARAVRDHAPRPWPLLLGLVAAAMLVPRVGPVDSHQWLTAVALKLSGHDRVYLREAWGPTVQPYLPPCAPERVRFDYLCT